MRGHDDNCLLIQQVRSDNDAPEVDIWDILGHFASEKHRYNVAVNNAIRRILGFRYCIRVLDNCEKSIVLIQLKSSLPKLVNAFTNLSRTTVMLYSDSYFCSL